MIPLPRELIRAAPFCTAPRFDLHPIQLGLGGSPWHVAVASLCLVKVRRDRATIGAVFHHWPTPEAMESSDRELEHLLRPLGLASQRARRIQLLSRRWRLDSWADLSEHPGCGPYVRDAVRMFCFGCFDMESNDSVLLLHSLAWKGPRMSRLPSGAYSVVAPDAGGDGATWSEFADPLDAYAHLRRVSQ